MAEIKEKNYEYVYGVNPLYSLITTNAGRRKIYKIFLNLQKKKDLRIQKLIAEAVSKKIDIEETGAEKFNESAGGSKGLQGIFAKVSLYNYSNLYDFLDRETTKKNGSSLKLIILDGVTDVGNFGSIIRNCHAFGFDGIIIPKDRSVAVNERVSKISAGALEEVKIFREVNITRTMKELKKRGFWIYGTTLDMSSGVKDLKEIDFTFPMAIVMGSEDKGISRLVERNCDIMIHIEQSGRMQSLNVSVASGIILYMVQEQIEKRN